MKKLALTIAIVLGLGISTFAQGGFYYSQEENTEVSGLFGLGTSFFNRDNDLTFLPNYNSFDEDTEDGYSNEPNYYYYYDGGSGLFGLGIGLFNNRNGGIVPSLPDFDSDEETDAPLGSGIAVLMGLGAAYLVAKKRKED